MLCGGKAAGDAGVGGRGEGGGCLLLGRALGWDCCSGEGVSVIVFVLLLELLLFYFSFFLVQLLLSVSLQL